MSCKKYKFKLLFSNYFNKINDLKKPKLTTNNIINLRMLMIKRK